MMNRRRSSRKTAGISGAAVRAATGRTWQEWFSLLDRAGARTMTHRQIVAVVGRRYGVGLWWQQMVTVGYEQGRGLRIKHERPDGFQISRSKTIAVPIGRAFKAWQNKKSRSAWLKEDANFAVRTATANKSMRITRVDGKTNVEVMFCPGGGQDPGRRATQQAAQRQGRRCNEGLLVQAARAPGAHADLLSSAVAVETA